MGVNEKKLRQRDPSGAWLHFPFLGRCQEVHGGPIWMDEEQVRGWVEKRDAGRRLAINNVPAYTPNPSLRGAPNSPYAKLMKSMGA